MCRFRSILPLLLGIGLLATAMPVRAQNPVAANAQQPLAERFKVNKNGDALLLPVSIDGKDHLFLVDTGCIVSVYDLSLLKGVPKTGSRSAGGQAESVLDTRYLVGPSRVGKIPLPGRPVVGLDLQRFRDVSGYEISGILGMDILRSCVVEINFDTGELTLSWSPRPQMKIASLFVRKDWGTAVALSIGTSLPRLLVAVGDFGKHEFILDTGSIGFGSADMSKPIFTSAQKQKRLRIVGSCFSETATGTSETSLGQIDKLVLGPFSVPQAIVGEQEEVCLLGLKFLSRFLVTLDFPNRTMYLRKGSNYDRPDACDRSGLSMLRKEGKTLVARVKPDSPAAQAGVCEGDVLVNVGGVAAGAQTMFELRQVLCTEGYIFPIVLDRGGERLETTLILPAP